MTHRLYLLGFVALSVIALSCEEELPPRVLEDFLEPVFVPGQSREIRIEKDPGESIFGEFTATPDVFRVGLKNLSDEGLESPARVRGEIELWLTQDDRVHRTFSFEDTRITAITIKPESLFTVSVEWDQRDDSCRYAFWSLVGSQFTVEARGQAIWYVSQTVLRFRARGKVQLFPNVETKELPEVEFTRTYAFNFPAGYSFLTRVDCDEP